MTSGAPGPPRLEHLVAVPLRAAPRGAADISGVDLAGTPRRVALTTPGSWTLLLFLGLHCDACAPFWTAPASKAALGLHDEDAVELVVRTPRDESGRLELREVVRLVREPADVVVSDDAWATYGVLGPPFFVLVDGESVVTEGVAWSVGQVAADVRRARARPQTEEPAST